MIEAQSRLNAVAGLHPSQVVDLEGGGPRVHMDLAAEGTSRFPEVEETLPAGAAILPLSGAAHGETGVEPVGVVPPFEVQVAGPDIGRVEASAIDRRDLGTGGGIGQQVLLHAADQVVGDRLDLDAAAHRVGLLDEHLLAAGDGVEETEGRASPGLSRELDGAQDRGVVGTLQLPAASGKGEPRGGPADAPRVEQARLPGNARDARAGGLEDLDALQEEGPALAVAGLKDGQVEHRRVALDLAEVRVDGGIEGDVGGQAVAQVQAGGGGQIVLAAAVSHGQDAAAQGEGQDLETAPRLDPLDPLEVTEARGVAGDAPGGEAPFRPLGPAADLAEDVDPPGLVLAEAQGVVGDLQLHAPAVRPHRRGGLGHTVPAVVEVVVVVDDPVADPARGADVEPDAGLMVVVGVEVDLEKIALARFVASRQGGGDAVGSVVADGGDVESVVVVGHLEGRAQRRRLAVVRIALGEALVQRGVLPDLVVDDSVKAGRDLCAHRDSGALGVRHPVLHLRITGGDGLFIGFGWPRLEKEDSEG